MSNYWQKLPYKVRKSIREGAFVAHCVEETWKNKDGGENSISMPFAADEWNLSLRDVKECYKLKALRT